jgi:phosphoribosylaminoimidazole-succinocarboxamide synthase
MPFPTDEALSETRLPLPLAHRGKVRDCYRLGDDLIIVSTDRISAYDWILPTPIPGKGRVLTALSAFWFERLGRGPDPVGHHLLSVDVDAMGLPATVERGPLRGRTMLVRSARVVPFECVVRGWLAGSGLAEYRRGGMVCGEPLPAGLDEGSPLPKPIFTPATKAVSGHDENLPFAAMAERLGPDLAETLRQKSLAVYLAGTRHAESRGIILADTKLEWGFSPDGQLLLVDEVLTPDSSRFWPATSDGGRGAPASFDKQFVRDWLTASGWDRQSPPPSLPPDIVAQTAARYEEALRRLMGPA